MKLVSGEEPKCSNCRYWQPTYHGIGECRRAGGMNAKFWVTENKLLLTVASFGCQSHECQADIAKDSL